jgi:hypothetical protein
MPAKKGKSIIDCQISNWKKGQIASEISGYRKG